MVRRFFVGGRPHTALVPADGAPAVLSKEKYIVVVVAGGVADQVAASGTDGLPAHQHVQLWHIGKQKADGVRFGYAADDGVFKHPACDVGGLTNLKQKLGEAASFVGAATAWEGAAAGDKRRDEVARALAAEWARLSRKTLPPTLAADLAKFLGTVGAAMGDHAVTLRFHALPPEHRTVVTSADVAAATGKYYVRIFGGDHHAKVSDGAGLFCGVTDKFVTPNLNEANLLSEYVTYAEKEAAAAEEAAAEAAAAEGAEEAEAAAAEKAAAEKAAADAAAGAGASPSLLAMLGGGGGGGAMPPMPPMPASAMMSEADVLAKAAAAKAAPAAAAKAARGIAQPKLTPSSGAADGAGPMATAAAAAKGAVSQWASSLLGFSSQFSAGDNSAMQVLGENRVTKGKAAGGSSVKAWSAVPRPGETKEWVRLGFKTAVVATEVHVFESFTPGSVSAIRLADSTEAPFVWVDVYTRADGESEGCGRWHAPLLRADARRRGGGARRARGGGRARHVGVGRGSLVGDRGGAPRRRAAAAAEGRRPRRVHAKATVGGRAPLRGAHARRAARRAADRRRGRGRADAPRRALDGVAERPPPRRALPAGGRGGGGVPQERRRRRRVGVRGAVRDRGGAGVGDGLRNRAYDDALKD